ncbi:hypothetical protein FQN60_015665 [Etheostoma spectabile]|uniref:Uncharacterized protein n=1 Tax=Etheostoma spectabile TaxID=54343 RepID=A0A5J5CQH3_9PERO|nr:hypothetical protein FQN60_015665 [Etheostoma spectabile]
MGAHNTLKPAIYWPTGMLCSGYNTTSWGDEKKERKAGREKGSSGDREKSELKTQARKRKSVLDASQHRFTYNYCTKVEGEDLVTKRREGRRRRKRTPAQTAVSMARAASCHRKARLPVLMALSQLVCVL